MMKLLLTSVLLCMTMPAFLCSIAGMKTRITQRGIDFFTKASQIRAMLPDIPDVIDSTEISVLGKVDYRVHGITITDLKLFPRSVLVIDPEVGGLMWKAQELQVALSGKWSFDTHSLIPISDSGSVTVKVVVNSSPFKLQLGTDSEGRLSIKQAVSGCHFTVGLVDIELSGGKEWLYNVFETNVEDMIKDAANDQICAVVEKLIREDLASALSSMEVLAPVVPEVANLDLSLLSDPAVNSYIDLLHKGEVVNVVNRGHGDIQRLPLPSDSDDERMFYLWLTDYTLNSAGFALESTDYLQYTLTQAEIPEDSSFILNTSAYELGLLLPQVSKVYPNMEVQCRIAPTRPPSFIILTEDGAEIRVVTNIELIVLGDNAAPVTIITLENDLELSLVLTVRESAVFWDVETFSCETSLIESGVEDFDFVIVESAIKFACHAFIKQYIKDMGTEGVPLPDIPGTIAMTNLSVVHGDGYLKMGFDLKG